MKKSVLVASISLLIGLAFFRVAFAFILNNQKTIQSGTKTTGTVVDNIVSHSDDGDTYKPKISYTDLNGQKNTYIPSYSSNPPEFKVGQSVVLYIDRENPSRIVVNSFMGLWFGPLILSVFGLIGVAIGAVIFRHQSNDNWLTSHGQRITASFTNIIPSNIEINHRLGQRLQCQWLNPKDNTVYIFNSDNIWYDITNFLTPNQPITVLIDPTNPKKYSVDISFLPPSN